MSALQLALSGRIEETGSGKKETGVTEFIKFAADIGYQGVELRPCQVNSNLSVKEISHIKEILDKYNMGLSFITNAIFKDANGFAVFQKDVDLALSLGTKLLRIDTPDIFWIQKSCDYLIKCNIDLKLFFQMHTKTPFETIEGG